MGAVSSWRERRVRTAQERSQCDVRGASARRGSGVILASEERQHGAEAALMRSKTPLQEGREHAAPAREASQHGAGPASSRRASQRRGRGVGGASGVSSRRGRGVRGASARHGGRYRGVRGASTRHGGRRHQLIVAWEGRHHGVELALCPCRRTRFYPCRGTFWVGVVTVDRNEEHC